MPFFLVSYRPATLRPKRSWLVTAGQVALMSSLFFGLAVLVAVGRFGSFESGRAYLGGSRVFVDQPIFSATYDPSSEEVSVRYELKNLGILPVAILGSNVSCSCTLLEDLPASIPARNSIIVSAIVRIDPNTSANGIKGSILIFTGHPNQSEIVLSYDLRPSEAMLSSASNHLSAAE